MSFNPFPIGTRLHLVTCFGDQHTGEVVTYEHSVKMLMLHCHNKDAAGATCHSQCIINLDYCKDLTIIQEANASSEEEKELPAQLDLQRLDQRLQQTTEQRRNSHATPRGRQLFQLLAQHFKPTELTWQQHKIVVLQQLCIGPPYQGCNICGAQRNPKLLHYVQRLVAQLDEQTPSK